MNDKRVREILRSCDALLEGHFVYTSGRHGSQYFEKIRIVNRPEYVHELGGMMASLMSDLNGSADLVCSPAFGAVVFGFSTALHMGKRFAFTQRDGQGRMSVRPGFRNAVSGSRIILVEDVCTTGGSVVESIDALRSAGGEVAEVGLVVDRTGGRLELGVPYRSLLSIEAASWESGDCPLCREGMPLTVPGSSGKKQGTG